ncbi:carotenoid 9,10(9',10')-cleavage dioxygenase 1-like isoform X2 [Andrographis paniculata]|uniref:carotenoid 9,10(9',10')-cleavage dioxygenase 1-like isoform X2 n=1 Tax=Andrographis paniculata TaxID=175694 RepID=UPI0021E7D365|nr:carotenoid 9,10(9',10')-cleavage dioxygenase 1-like isoform X2 [Andrographis paniculata]
MSISKCALIHMSSSADRTPFTHNFKPFAVTPFKTAFQKNVPTLQINAPYRRLKEASVRLLDAFVDLMFVFVDEPLLPSQSNFAPVEEAGEAVQVSIVEGAIPDEFPEGVYIRNGANPLYGGLKSAVSIFGKTSSLWVEGEGMVHAVYFKKDGAGNWTTSYNNRYVETETYLLEKDKNRPYILPAAEGIPSAVLSSYLINLLRLRAGAKQYSNTNVVEHGGRFFSVTETHSPQEIDIHTLETLGDWTIDGAWTRPFTSHPKKVPGTGELLIMGCDNLKPYYEVGIISADGSKLVHKEDLKFDRTVISHEIGVTQRLIKYEKDKHSRIGVMPRYGNAESVKWFAVEPSCAFHLINCFENGDDEVVVMGCKGQESIIPGPDFGVDKFKWFSRGFKNVYSVEENGENTDQDGMLFARAYEWRLNMKTGEVTEGYLTGTEFSMDFPLINPSFTGLKNRYAYTQVVDSSASSAAGMPKYSGLAKLHLEGTNDKLVEYHMFPENTYCSGAAFVSKPGASEEDDGWIVAFVHDEDADKSQVYIVDANRISGGAVAKIGLNSRVPYGFHGIFSPI